MHIMISREVQSRQYTLFAHFGELNKEVYLSWYFDPPADTLSITRERQCYVLLSQLLLYSHTTS